MNLTASFIRIVFLSVSMLFGAAYTMTFSETPMISLAAPGIAAGGAFGIALIGVEFLLKRFNLRTFNIAVFGLFCGYLMGAAILLMLNAASLPVPHEIADIFKIALFLSTGYVGMMMAVRASDEIMMSIPFVTFRPAQKKKKDLLADASALQDPRIIDLASSGIIDNMLIIPRFLVNDMQTYSESMDDTLKNKGRSALDTIKKLQNLPNLELRYTDMDFPEIPDPMTKLLRLARSLEANILTTDLTRTQSSALEGIRIININSLSNALKPLTQTGETLLIKIQRYGKEARQGVGYLDDGTMVVVNGGAEFIGETIKVQVLSVKHTSSGRMIFCNASDGTDCNGHDIDRSVMEMSNSHKNYFAL